MNDKSKDDEPIRRGAALDAVYRADSLELASYGESRIAERIAAIEPVQHLGESSVKPGQLFFDGDGDVCVAAPGDNLVFCPAVDDEGRKVLHPEIIAKMVQIYNAHVAAPLSPTAVDSSPAPDTGAKVAALVDALDNLLEAVTASAETGDRALTITGSTANLKWLLESEEDARTALAAWEGRE